MFSKRTIEILAVCPKCFDRVITGQFASGLCPRCPSCYERDQPCRSIVVLLNNITKFLINHRGQRFGVIICRRK